MNKRIKCIASKSTMRYLAYRTVFIKTPNGKILNADVISILTIITEADFLFANIFCAES